MLEYFTYKKLKGHRDAKKAEKDKHDAQQETAAAAAAAAAPASTAPSNLKSPQSAEPVLSDDDERFLERITSEDAYADEDGRRPPLPPRVKTPKLSLDSDDESHKTVEAAAAAAGKELGKEAATTPPGQADKKASRFSFFRRRSRSGAARPGQGSAVEPSRLAVPAPEAERERDDITRVLDDLNLAAQNNKTFSLSEESTELVRQFTLVLKDLVSGVPTAARDLQALLRDHDGVLARQYEKLPRSMKKLVTQLPSKLTGSLAPELLAVAAESQGLAHDTSSRAGVKDTAKRLLTPRGLQDLVTRPGAIVGMLKAIVNALKVRWPAFMGTNVIWSIALFLLLFVLWYCHKRGRETRLEQEMADSGELPAEDRVEELPDDPALPAPGPASPANLPSPVILVDAPSPKTPTRLSKGK